MTEKRDLIYLAGLLHDIDSFWISGDFFEVFGKYFQKEVALEGEDGLISLIKNYKQPTNISEGTVFLADTWASGLDRHRTSETDEPQHLQKIFNSLEVNGKIANSNSSYPIAELSIKSEILGNTNLKFTKEILHKLNGDFEVDFKKLPKSNLKEFLYSLYYLLKKYTWCVPAYKKATDISLFEHSKLTAAIAQSLFDYYQFNKNSFDENLNLKKGRLPLSLWCIDISGIQKFIYNISSKYASKSLKGRSFYLQAILDRLTDYIIQETKTTQSHIVYSSGGKFFMILPKTDIVKDAMKKIESELQEYLWEDSFYVCFGKDDWRGDTIDLGNLWSNASKNASEQKIQKFKNLLIDKNSFEKFFNGKLDEGGQKAICLVSGVEIDRPLVVKKSEGEINISKKVLQQIELGNDLKELKYYEKYPIGSIEQIFNISVNRKEGKANSHISFPSEDNIDFIKNQASGFQFYGGSELATINSETKTFEELVGILREKRDSDNSKIILTEGNYNRLGVLRMDVDNLGKLFTEGFPKDSASFSAFATLSNTLDWFFSGFLNTIRRKPDYKDSVNIIYSGGDDVFAVGRWNKIIAFAAEIKETFEIFVGRNDITISAGLTIVTPKFPIAKAAAMAGYALEKAKNFERDNKTKNAITIFDEAVGWEEYESVYNWGKKLSSWLINGSISSGILQKIFIYYGIYKMNKENPFKEKQNLSWKWNATYTLARQAKDTNIEAKRDALNQIKNIIFTEIDQNKTFRFEAFIVACRWAELEVRDIKQSTISN